MLDADVAELPDWSAGYDDVSFDETSDLLFGTTFACADEPFLLAPQPGPQQQAGSASHDQPDSRSAPAAAATSMQSTPTPPRKGADAAGKAAGRLEKKAEQNRRAVSAGT